jgi:hypothetical protein
LEKAQLDGEKEEYILFMTDAVLKSMELYLQAIADLGE